MAHATHAPINSHGLHHYISLSLIRPPFSAHSHTHINLHIYRLCSCNFRVEAMNERVCVCMWVRLKCRNVFNCA